MARRSVWWALGLFGVLGCVCAISGVILCEAALHPPRRPVPELHDARTVEITSRDGIPLRAWLFSPASPNGDAVLLLHGIADSRASQAGFARMFVSHGYAVLVPDSRAHGESGGELATYGLLEAGDTHEWVSWLIEHQHPRRVFGVGESLGGAVLLQSLRLETRFSGVVAESSYATFEGVARDRLAEMLSLPLGLGRCLAAAPVWTGFIYARARYGLDFRRASPEAALARSTTPVLLIHGLADAKTPPEHSIILAAANSRTTTLWLVPGAGHCGAYAADAREFERRVLDFFQNSSRGSV